MLLIPVLRAGHLRFTINLVLASLGVVIAYAAILAVVLLLNPVFDALVRL